MFIWPNCRKTCWKFFTKILPFAKAVKSGFFSSIWDPKIDWFPVWPFGLMFVKNNWWGVWPSCQMRKNCCWPIWPQKSGKSFRPKKQFSQILFLDRKFFLCKKSYQYQNSNSPLFSPIVKKRIGSFSRGYWQFGPVQKVSFFDLGPKNRLIPNAAIWLNVREKWLMESLTVFPNDEELLLTDLSAKVRKKFKAQKTIFANLVFGAWSFVL